MKHLMSRLNFAIECKQCLTMADPLSADQHVCPLFPSVLLAFSFKLGSWNACRHDLDHLHRWQWSRHGVWPDRQTAGALGPVQAGAALTGPCILRGCWSGPKACAHQSPRGKHSLGLINSGMSHHRTPPPPAPQAYPLPCCEAIASLFSICLINRPTSCFTCILMSGSN